MIALEPIATLGVSAASGLVRRGDELFVVADDELALARYGLDGAPRGSLRLFDGELPRAHAQRKRAKPDLEALVDLEDGRMLALGSGSTEQRARGALIEGDAVRVVDLRPLYDVLAQRFDRLNIEGASVLDDRLLLFTRRTGASGRNAIVRLDLAATRAALRADAALPAELLADIVELELGDCEGAPYGLTDATRSRDELLVTVAAEQTDDPYEDGRCCGCAIASLDRDGKLRALWPVTPTVKLEGIALLDDSTALVVADADDPTIPSPLYRATLPKP